MRRAFKCLLTLEHVHLEISWPLAYLCTQRFRGSHPLSNPTQSFASSQITSCSHFLAVLLVEAWIAGGERVSIEQCSYTYQASGGFPSIMLIGIPCFQLVLKCMFMSCRALSGASFASWANPGKREKGSVGMRDAVHKPWQQPPKNYHREGMWLTLDTMMMMEQLQLANELRDLRRIQPPTSAGTRYAWIPPKKSVARKKY